MADLIPIDTTGQHSPYPYSVVNPAGISAYAIERTGATDAYILQLGNLAASLTPPVINPVFPNAVAPTPITTSVPTITPIVWTAPAAPAAFTATLDVTSLMPATFDVAAPTLSFGTAPAVFSGAAPDAPGINLQFDYPTLSVALPAAPSLLSLSVSSFGGLTLPTIDPTIPAITVSAPSIREYVPGAQYTSGLLTSLRASLQSRIDNGGTGLSPAVEQAIWDRGREKEVRQAADAQAALDQMEALGYAFPSGAYLDAKIKIQTELAYQAAGHSREVMIKQAELEQANVLAALDKAVAIETTAINYANQIEQRLFDSSKYATEAGIAIYNAQVQAYAAFLEAYKTKVAIYEAQIRGELAKVDVYKAQIEAEQVKAQINTALVEQYKVQSELALSSIEVFKAQIGAIQTKAEIEKIKVETFGEQVKAYGMQINAYTAGVEGYRASIQAEGVKQDAYRSQVQAYSAKVDAAVKQIDARISEYRGRLEAFTAAYSAYKSAYEAEGEKAKAIAEGNSSVTDAYRATIQGLSSYNDTLTKQWQVALDQAQRVSEIGVSAAKANADLYITTRSLALDASKVGAQVASQLGAAALNATSWHHTFGVNDSYSTGYSITDSRANNTVTEYIYSSSV